MWRASKGLTASLFFAVAQSDNGIDNWRFWPEPITMPDGNNAPATNVYDMRLTQHEDGYIYGIFCVEVTTRRSRSTLPPPPRLPVSPAPKTLFIGNGSTISNRSASSVTSSYTRSSSALKW